MSWRKWIVRGVVYGIITLCGAAALAYQRWTNPAAVREQVIAKLHELFPGAQVSVDSANLRILGGIQLGGLRLCRRDDPERNEFLHVSSAVFYHDKEKVLDGQLVLRKIELHRPRLRVRRDRHGRWNLQGLTGILDPTRPLPTVVVHQGTVIFEDHQGDASAPLMEVGDVNITLINDPLPIVNLRGAASSEAAGKLQVQGMIRRDPIEVAATFGALRVPITTALVGRLGSSRCAALVDGLEIEALADIRGEMSYRPEFEQSLCYDCQCTITRGKVRHPRLPLPLEELSATLYCSAGRVRLESLQARSGAAEVSAEGTGMLPDLDQDFEGRLVIKHLALGKELRDPLPEKLRRLHDAFAPRGPATVEAVCGRRRGQWVTLADGTPSRVSLRPEDVSMCFARFAYPVEHLTGALDYDLLDHRVNVDVAGRGSGQPVSIKGTWQGEGTQAEARFDIEAAGVPIDETLLKALPQAEQTLARSFRATGRADIAAHIRRDRGAAVTEYRNEYHVQVRDGTLLWDSFPYLLEHVRGILDIYPHKRWEFRDFHAAHQGGEVDAHGRSTQTHTADGSPAHGIALSIVGRNLPLDSDLRNALGARHGLLRSWDTFRPRGRLNFVATVDQPTGQAEDLDVRVEAEGCAALPVFFPYPLQNIGGRFHYHNKRLDLSQVTAWHGDTLLSLGTGNVDLHPPLGYYADLTDLQARDLVLDEDLLAALPAKLQEAARSLKLHDQCQVKSRLIVSQAAEPGSRPDIYWRDCQVWFNNATLTAGVELSRLTGMLACTGRHDGQQLLGLNGNVLLDQTTVLRQPFHDVQLAFEVRKNAPDVLLVGVHAPLFAGDVSGQVRIDFNSTVRYEVNLTASQIDLKQFGAHNFPKSGVEGLAVGRLHLTGLGSDIETLDGNGSIDVPTGKILNLPLLLDLLKFLGLHWPDRTAFEEMHALFGLHGRRVHLRRLDLFGNAISLSGKGEFDIDGNNLQADFYPTWRVEQFLPPAVRPVPSTISKSLLTIDMRGKVGGNPDKELKFTKRWVPVIFDPLQSLQQRLVGELRLEKKD
jgi:hypothetical protein